MQAVRYEASKALIIYSGSKYDHRIYDNFEQKDATAGRITLVKPTPPIIDKVVQEATLGECIKVMGVLRSVIDKNGEDYVMYHIRLKQHVSDLSKYEDNLEKYFSVIIGQCSPAIEQIFEGDESFMAIKVASDSIRLMKILERICYNYHETFKTIVELCKVSGINFVVMCSANANMAIIILHREGKVSKVETYMEETYFTLSADERKAVDDMVEKIFLSTRFLSLSSEKLHGFRKQELKNYLTKGDDKYPRTISDTINFLQ